MATPTPVPAPAPKSGGALKIILIVLGVIALVIVLIFGALAYGCYHLAHSIAQSEHGKSTVSAFGTTMTASDSASFTASDLGVDLYPGATPTDGGSKLQAGNTSIIIARYLTSDPVSKVEAFYKDKFGTVSNDWNVGGTAMIVHKVSDKETINVTATNSGQDGKTKITIQHTKTK